MTQFATEILDLSIAPILVSDSCIPISGFYSETGAWFDLTTNIGPYSTPVLVNPRVIVHLADGDPLVVPVDTDINTTPCSPVEVTITWDMETEL